MCLPSTACLIASSCWHVREPHRAHASYIMHPYLRQVWAEMPPVDQLPRSAILGFLHIARVLPLEDIPQAECELGCTGPFVWVVDRVRLLPQVRGCAHMSAAAGRRTRSRHRCVCRSRFRALARWACGRHQRSYLCLMKSFFTAS